MYLEGQADGASSSRERGFALAALLVAIAVLSVLMLVAMPTWRHQAQREKEIELIFRGEQYARAIGLYQRKLAGAFPPSLEILVEQKFLRRKYLDPLTGEDFVPVLAGSPLLGGIALPAQPGMASPGGVGQSDTPGGEVFQNPDDAVTGGLPVGVQAPGTGILGAAGIGQGGPGARAGVAGVMSKAKGQSIRLYNGRNRYDQWIFVYTAPTAQAGQVASPGQGPDQMGVPRPGPGRGGQ
jgi:type II secretory pathway pseudopilin PulG